MITLPDVVVGNMKQENETLKERLINAEAKLAKENTVICEMAEQMAALRCELGVAVSQANSVKNHAYALEGWALKACEALHNLLSVARPYASDDGVWPHVIKAAKEALDNDVISYQQKQK